MQVLVIEQVLVLALRNKECKETSTSPTLLLNGDSRILFLALVIIIVVIISIVTCNELVIITERNE